MERRQCYLNTISVHFEFKEIRVSAPSHSNVRLTENWNNERQIEGSRACKKQIKGWENMVLQPQIFVQSHSDEMASCPWCRPTSGKLVSPAAAAFPCPAGNYQRYLTWCRQNTTLSEVCTKIKCHKKGQLEVHHGWFSNMSFWWD